jgi:hypothetical protein
VVALIKIFCAEEYWVSSAPKDLVHEGTFPHLHWLQADRSKQEKNKELK